MAGTFSDYLEQHILGHIFKSETYAKPTTIAMALTSDIPVDGQTGATIQEISNAGAYARVNYGAPTNALWSMTASGQITNNSAITFPECTSAWGWASGIAITDNSTYGAGNLLAYSDLSPAKLVTVGDTVFVAVSGLQISVS